MLEERGAELIQHVLARAEAGDMAALRLCLDRALPRGRDRPVRFALPRMERVEDTPAAVADISAALGAGTLTPREAAELLDLVGHFIQAVEAAHEAERAKTQG